MQRRGGVGKDGDNFGDRLGVHMINALLPGEADVHHLTFRTLHEARASYDLVVLGTGNSLFQPLLGDDASSISSGEPRRRSAFSARNTAS